MHFRTAQGRSDVNAGQREGAHCHCVLAQAAELARSLLGLPSIQGALGMDASKGFAFLLFFAFHLCAFHPPTHRPDPRGPLLLGALLGHLL